MRATLSPAAVDRIVTQIEFAPDGERAVRIETPNSLMGLITASAPHAIIQMFFALLVSFVGALILLYSGYYLKEKEQANRFFGRRIHQS